MSTKILESTIGEIKLISPERLASNNVIAPARNGGYCCPNCGNGTGDSGTGIEPNLVNGVWLYNCFKCGEAFDNIKLLTPLYGQATFPELIQQICNDYNIPFERDTAIGENKSTPPRSFTDAHNLTPVDNHADEGEKALIDADILTAKDNLHNLPADQRRGLTLETLEHFGCGYLEKWTAPKSRLNRTYNTPTPRLIVPHYGGYLARLTVSPDAFGDKAQYITEKMHAGTKSLFNASAMTAGAVNVIVEGEIDAMSIWQATGGKIPVMATLGASNNHNSVIDTAKSKFGTTADVKPKFLILFDGDDSGRSNAATLRDKLISAGFPAAVAFFAGEENSKLDANEIITSPNGGDKALEEKVYALIAAAQIDLDKAAATIDKVKSAGNDSISGRAKTRRDNVALTTRQFLKDCPLDLCISPRYRFDKTGALWRNVGEDKGEVLVCSTPVIVSGNLISNSRMEFVELSFRTNGVWRKEICEKILIADSRRIIELASAGITLTSKTAQYLSEYLVRQIDWNGNDKIIPTLELRSQPGWMDDNCTRFAYPNSDDNVRIYRDDFDYDKAFTVKGDYSRWKELCVEVMKASVAARFAVGAALAAPLVKLLGISNQWCHISNRSGAGKTGVNKFGASIYGDPARLMMKFGDTFNSIDKTGAFFNDLPNFVEELQSASARARDSVSDLVYRYAEGETRGRLNKNAFRRPTEKFRGVRISSGEQTITTESSGEGVFKRTVELTFPDVLPNDLAIKVHSFTADNYGLAGREWIKAIIDNAVGIKGMFDAYCDHFTQHGIEGTYPNHRVFVCACTTAIIFFCRCVLKIEPSDVGYSSDDEVAIFNILPKRTFSSNADRAIGVVAEFILSHPALFNIYDAETGDDAPPPIAKLPAVTIYGYKVYHREPEVTLIYPKALREILSEFPSADACIRGFSENGWLIEGNSERHPHQKSVKINGKSARFYAIRNDALYQEDNEDDSAV